MLAWVERNPFLVLGVAGFLLLAGLFARDAAGGDPPAALVVREGVAAEGGLVQVQVAGAVHVPGVYELDSRARVRDAIATAGGATADARLEDLNLARFVRDGERIEVPGPAGSPSLSTEVTGGLLDLNTASQSQLMTLNGIGEAYSRRIIDSRTVDGAYRSVDELRTRNLLPVSTFEKVRDLVTVAP
jgi:competence protein ComEA